MLALAAVSAIAIALALTMRVALANDLHQFEESHNPDGISWDAPFPPDDPTDCDGVAPGDVLWHFVHTDTGLADLPSKLTAEFATAGTLEADGYQNGNSIVMYDITTGHDTLLSASDDIENGGNLNLSHICVGPEQSVEESASASESVPGSAEQSVAGSEAESVPASAEQSVAGSEAESESEAESASAAESAEQSVEGSEAESESEAESASAAESAEQSVEGSEAESASVAESAEQSVEGSEAESAEQSVEGSETESAEQSVEGSEAMSADESFKAGEGTPAGSVSNSSFFGAGSAALPTILFSLVLLASLGTLAYANVKAVRNRN
jgi:hypothetical protein